MQVEDKIIDIPPLNTMLKFVEFALFHDFDLQQWGQHFGYSPRNGSRQFLAAKWALLMRGDIRFPGTWRPGPNLDILRNNGRYSLNKLSEIVSLHSLFQIALDDLENEVDEARIRLNLEAKIFNDYSKEDGSDFSSATATLRSSQVLTWSKMIIGEVEINLSGVGYLLPSQSTSVTDINLNLRRSE